MTTLRTEIFYGEPMGTVLAGTTIAATHFASRPWAPTYGPGMDSGPLGEPHKTATFEAFGGPVYVSFGKAPNPLAEPRRLVRPGLKVLARIQAGDCVSVIVATDISV